MGYLNRVFDAQLRAHLSAMGAVLIEGPKWCGKTTTAKQMAKSVLSLQDTDLRSEYLATAMAKPSFLLEGDTPRLIDEWQDAPMLWDAVRTKVDERGLPGQFILTGSNSVDDSKILHSGTGRISRLEMLPMSLWEYGESNGSFSLIDMFDNPQKEIFATSDMSVEAIIFAACRGGCAGPQCARDRGAPWPHPGQPHPPDRAPAGLHRARGAARHAAGRGGRFQ